MDNRPTPISRLARSAHHGVDYDKRKSQAEYLKTQGYEIIASPFRYRVIYSGETVREVWHKHARHIAVSLELAVIAAWKHKKGNK